MSFSDFGDVEKLLEIPWPDEVIDRNHCFEILYDMHPDGYVGPFSEKYNDANELIFEIQLNPIVCAWIIYFEKKYGSKLGTKLIRRFLYEHIFGYYFSHQMPEIKSQINLQKTGTN